MADYILSLTNEQEIALLYDTEQMNKLQAGQLDIDKNPLKDMTVDDVLSHCIKAHLSNVQRNMDSLLVRYISKLKTLSSTQRNMVITTFASPAEQKRLAILLTQ